METLKNTPRRLPVWFVAAAALLVVLLVTFVMGLSSPWSLILAAGAALVVAGWALFRFRAEKAAHEATIARWAVSEAIFAERLRIARDLHDIISHGLGMITMRAAAARHIHIQNPSEEALLEAMEDIEKLSRQTTLELRRMLGALREVDDTAPRHPADTLELLPELIDAAQHAGLQVELEQEGLGPVSPGTQVTICAIVREGLTNAARHAGPTRVQVRLCRRQDTIAITITDDGPGAGWTPAPGAGNGLIGLRERVNRMDGSLHAGPYETGFRLEATLPEEIQ